MKESIGILATKKLTQNQKQYLLNACFNVIDEDFIHIQPIAFEIKNTNDILIFTSQNAVLNVLTNKDELIHKPAIYALIIYACAYNYPNYDNHYF